jgi:immunity protein 53 of polymorphic toxin system
VSPIEFLQSWYLAQSNGEWQQIRGVTIESLDNPGWLVTIDLAETALDGRSMQPVRDDRSARDWMTCEVDHNQFRGQGDPLKLAAILEVFQNWATSPTVE